MRKFQNLAAAEEAAKTAAEEAAAAKTAKEGRPFVAEPFGNSGSEVESYYVADSDSEEGFEEFSPEFLLGENVWVVALYPFFEAPNRTFLK